MCVQIGNRLFAELRIAHSGLRKGRRDGPDSVCHIRTEKSLFQMGFRSEACLGWLDGLTGRSARTRDFVRLGKKILGGSGETGGWAKAAGVGAAGGALAQNGAKRCMYSCDDLLCILSGRAESIKVARSGANCRVNSCADLALSAISFCGLAQRVAPAAAALWSVQPSMFCKEVCVC